MLWSDLDVSVNVKVVSIINRESAIASAPVAKQSRAKKKKAKAEPTHPACILTKSPSGMPGSLWT